MSTQGFTVGPFAVGPFRVRNVGPIPALNIAKHLLGNRWEVKLVNTAERAAKFAPLVTLTVEDYPSSGPAHSAYRQPDPECPFSIQGLKVA